MNKKNLKNNKKKSVPKKNNNLNVQNIISSKKLRYMLIIIFIFLILLCFRLFYLQVINGSYLASLASKQQTVSEEISSKRGNIYDATGSSLAISETVDTISVNPSKIKAKNPDDIPKLRQKIAEGLSQIFELDYDETLNNLNSTSPSVVIAKKVEEDKVNKLKQWMKDNKISAGINIDEDSKRYYPYGSLCSQIIGVCGTDNHGLSGIENSYDSILTGVAGKIVTSTDASQSEIPNSQESFIEAENGYNLTLTIDINIQSIVEKYLKQAVEENECSKGGNAIVMDPNTGNILAMATITNYDLNHRKRELQLESLSSQKNITKFNTKLFQEDDVEFNDIINSIY